VRQALRGERPPKPRAQLQVDYRGRRQCTCLQRQFGGLLEMVQVVVAQHADGSELMQRPHMSDDQAVLSSKLHRRGKMAFRRLEIVHTSCSAENLQRVTCDVRQIDGLGGLQRPLGVLASRSSTRCC